MTKWQSQALLVSILIPFRNLIFINEAVNYEADEVESEEARLTKVYMCLVKVKRQ